MKKIKCIVIDDEALARRLLKNYIEQLPHLELVGVCKNPMEATAILQEQPVDLMFLDIQMPQITGITFLKTLIHKPLVVFTTAYEKYALEGYTLDVVDYLLKPFGFERFIQAVNKASARLNYQIPNAPNAPNAPDMPNAPDTLSAALTPKPEKDYILVKSEHKIYRLKFDDIHYIQSMQAYVAYYTPSERILSLNRMKKLEAELPKSRFIRVHKSYIVAIEQTHHLEGNLLIVGKDKVKIPIGASYREAVLKRLFEG